MFRLLQRFAVLGLLVGIWSLLTAASPQTEQTAFGIAGVLAVILPFALKLVPWIGHNMVAFCVGSSVVIAVIAMFVSSEAKLTDLQHTDVPTLILLFLTVEALSQRLYSILLQSPKTDGAVT